MTTLTAARTASCACGRLTATCEGEPLRVSVCHCNACKQRTGSALSYNARWPEGAVRRAGTSRSFVRIGDEGGRITYHFCPDCGVTVWYLNDDLPGMVAIPVGAFATRDVPPPAVSVYHTARKAPWLDITVEPLTLLD